jgi:Cysteine rich repeat
MQHFAITAKCLILVIATASLSTTAFAQANSAMVNACRSDAQSLCASVAPGGGRVAQCLQQHEAKLSPTCKAQLATISECSQQVKDICGPQASTPRAMRSCFAENSSQFSAACRSAGVAN